MASRKLEVVFVGDTAQLEKSFKRVGKGADDTGNQLGGASGKLGELKGFAGEVAGKAGLLGVAAGFVSAARSGIDFEKQLSALGAVTDANATQMKALKKSAMDAGAATAFSAKEAAQAQTELAKGGVSVKDILGGGLKGALALAAAGELDLADAAATTANALNLFGLKGKSAGHVADALASAANATTADVSDFAIALTQGGAAAKAVGLSMDQTVLGLEALASAGVKGSDAGTSLKTAFVHLANPTDEAAGKMKALGLNFFTAKGEMKSMQSISAMLNDKLGGLTRQQRLQAIATIAGTDGMRTLLSIMDAGPGKLNKLEAGLKKQGSAAELAAKKQDNLAGRFEQLMGSVETLSIALTSSLLPVASKIVVGLTAVVNVITASLPVVAALVSTLVDLAPVILPVVAGFVAFKAAVLIGGALDTLKLGMEALRLVYVAQTGVTNASTVSVLAHAAAQKITTAATTVMTAAQAGLNAVMALNPIALVIAGIVAFGAALVIAYKRSETFREIVDGAWASLRSVAVVVFPAIRDAVVGAFDAIKTKVKAILDVLVPIVSTAWAAISTVIGFQIAVIKAVVTTQFEIVKTIITTTWAVVKAVTTTAWAAISGVLSTALGAIKTLVSTEINGIKTIVSAGWTAISSATSAAWAAIKSALSVVWGAIETAATSAWGGIKTAVVSPITSAVSTVMDKVRDMRDSLAKVWTQIKTGITGFAGDVRDGIVGAFTDAVNKVVGFVNEIIGVINKVPGVDIKPVGKLARGGQVTPSGVNHNIPGYARGGVVHHDQFAKGGEIARPMVVVGEEAPRHNEFVIPTNPAYRDRALGLYSQLGSQLGVPGFAEGGVIGGFRRATEQTNAGPKASLALWMAGIVESGLRNLTYGDLDSRGSLQIRDSTARGMGVNNMDPFASAVAFLTRGFWGKGGAISLASRTGNSAGWVAQQAQGSAYPDRYDTVRAQAEKYAAGGGDSGGGGGGGGGGILGGIGGLLGGAFGLLKDGASALLGKLPGVGDLPGWLAGTGKFVLGKATSYIKDKAAGLLGLGGGGGVGNLGGDGGSLSKFMDTARKFGLSITSTTGGQHASGSYHYQGRAFDASNGSGPTPEMMGFAKYMLGGYGKSLAELFYTPLGFSVKNGQRADFTVPGHDNHVHVAMAQGGVAPGGWVRVGELGAEWAQLPQGTRVHSASDSERMGPGSGPVIGEVHIHQEADERIIARELAWQIKNG